MSIKQYLKYYDTTYILEIRNQPAPSSSEQV